MAKTQEKTQMFSKLSVDSVMCEMALLALYTNQTKDEIQNGATLHINDTGFSASVSVKLQIIAKRLLNGEHFGQFEHGMVAASISTNWPQLINKGFWQNYLSRLERKNLSGLGLDNRQESAKVISRG